MRRIEKKRWEEGIERTMKARERGMIGDTYKCIKKLGTKGRKTSESCKITVNVFREHFKQVSGEV